MEATATVAGVTASFHVLPLHMLYSPADTFSSMYTNIPIGFVAMLLYLWGGIVNIQHKSRIVNIF